VNLGTLNRQVNLIPNITYDNEETKKVDQTTPIQSLVDFRIVLRHYLLYVN